MPVIICICIHFNIYQGIMMASLNRNIVRITGPLWGKSTGHRWIPLTKASDAGLYVFFDLRLNKWSNKRSRRWRFETQLRTLWRHCYDSAGRLHSSSIFSNSAASVLFIQMPQHLFPKPMNVQNSNLWISDIENSFSDVSNFRQLKLFLLISKNHFGYNKMLLFFIYDNPLLHNRNHECISDIRKWLFDTLKSDIGNLLVSEFRISDTENHFSIAYFFISRNGFIISEKWFFDSWHRKLFSDTEK